MRHVDEYRRGDIARRLSEAIHAEAIHPWTLMEMCGGQTHTIIKSGLHDVLPSTINLVHGPGCPVCVTPVEIIDKAIALARRPGVILSSFGDMLRVPGSSADLLTVKAAGGNIRIVYSPLDAVAIAEKTPEKEVVFFAVGFETTAPANAMAVRQAKERRLRNFSLLCSHVLVPPAIKAILSSPGNLVQGFLAAGHVCTVMGYEEYIPLSSRYKVPIVVTGFEPVDILQGILMTVRQLESGRCEVENQYSRSVRKEGNPLARALLEEVFQVTDRAWRGIGMIPSSGYKLRREYAGYDAELRFPLDNVIAQESSECIAGMVLQGRRKPFECPVFRTKCTPEHPLGAPMVSSEGACAAYFHYGKTGT